MFYLLFCNSFITLQGFPTATTFAGISLFTTLPAPITELSPIVTPGSTITFPPIHTLFPILIIVDYSIIFAGLKSICSNEAKAPVKALLITPPIPPVTPLIPPDANKSLAPLITSDNAPIGVIGNSNKSTYRLFTKSISF